MDEWAKSIIKDFLGNNWAAFEAHCDNFKADSEEVYQEFEDKA